MGSYSTEHKLKLIFPETQLPELNLKFFSVWNDLSKDLS